MSFDWQRFLTSHRIEYFDRGPSTAKNNIYVRCPFCGGADGGHHMGIHLEGKGWGCWKNSAHRGKAPQRLIQALIGCSWMEAARLAGKAPNGLEFGGAGILEAVQDALGVVEAGEVEAPPLRMPKEFKGLDANYRAGLACWDYLRRRGFTDREVTRIADHFDLRYAQTGDWIYRVIIPIRDESKRLLSWTGRAINADAKARYKTLSLDPEAEPRALIATSDLFLDLPRLFSGGKFLVICEGPFDAIRLAHPAMERDGQATCLFGKTVSASQLDYIARLRPAFDHVFLLLDSDAAFDALRIVSDLTMLGVIPVFMRGAKDPAEMPRSEMEMLLDKMASNRVAA